MTRLLLLALALASCTAKNPAAAPVAVDIPPGLARWCLTRNGASISCFDWDGARCAAWGCAEIPWYTCPDEGSAPWPFSCEDDGAPSIEQLEQAIAAL